MKVTLKYAGATVGPIEVSEGTTVSALTSNPSYSTVLGFDRSNVEAYVNGSLYEGVLRDNDVVTLQQKAHRKA